MAGTRTYAPKEAPLKPGWYKSCYGGIEKTQLASLPLGIARDVTPITQDQSPAGKRKRIRERKDINMRCEKFEREIAALLDDADDTRITQEFHNGG
jgi:hypothetical protein